MNTFSGLRHSTLHARSELVLVGLQSRCGHTSILLFCSPMHARFHSAVTNGKAICARSPQKVAGQRNNRSGIQNDVGQTLPVAPKPLEFSYRRIGSALAYD